MQALQIFHVCQASQANVGKPAREDETFDGFRPPDPTAFLVAAESGGNIQLFQNRNVFDSPQFLADGSDYRKRLEQY